MTERYAARGGRTTPLALGDLTAECQSCWGFLIDPWLHSASGCYLQRCFQWAIIGAEASRLELKLHGLFQEERCKRRSEETLSTYLRSINHNLPAFLHRESKPQPATALSIGTLYAALVEIPMQLCVQSRSGNDFTTRNYY